MQIKFKKYGTAFATEYLFKNKHRINQRFFKLNISKNFINLFKKHNRKVLTEKKLFDFRNSNIDFLKLIKCYRGIRHKIRLPVRGQRTHTNAAKKVYKKRKYE